MVHARNNIWRQPPARLRRKAERQIGTTAIAVAQSDDILALRIDLRQQYRGFVGFGAAVRKKDFSNRPGVI